MHMPMSCICVYMCIYVFYVARHVAAEAILVLCPYLLRRPHVARTMPVTYYYDSRVLILCLYVLCLYLVLWLCTQHVAAYHACT